MSEPINDGGQAFPRSGYDGPDCSAIGVDGMTLRDYFAAKALVGFIVENATSLPDTLATWSYQVADAMLKAREVNHE
jgi:hypothetical protein